MLTVTALAQHCDISRATVLYYEKLGLLLPAHRAEIGQLREQQRAIVALLQEPHLLESNMVSKDRWVEIMKAAGFDEQSMLTWHRKFEEMEPEEHQKFLESPGIEEQEIKSIRSL